MIAAIYARKSTDQHAVADEQKSVTRQIDHARAYAARKGWVVAEAHVYIDDGISGAEFSNRPGFVRLMNALKPRAPFAVLILSEASRLGRELFETGYALKQLSQAGVRSFSYLDDREIALDTATEKFMMSAATFAAEIEREKARQRVTDTMARKARAAHVCGGSCFGYTNVEVLGPSGKRSHVEQRIHEAEALVREIFAWSANGDGFTRIAKRLNAEGAPCPRPMPGRPVGWAPTSVRAILLRTKYRGEVVYNATRKRDQWGQKKTSDRPESEWIRAAAPALRIVTDDVWQAAHARLTGIRAQLGTFGRRRTRDIESQYLLSGFARCGVRGGSLCPLHKQRGQGQPMYGCSSYHKRGTAVCANGLRLPIERVDDAVLEKIRCEVLHPAAVMALVDGVFKALQPQRRTGDAAMLRSELQRVDREVGRLTEAIATGGPLAALLEALKALETRRDDLTSRLTALQSFDGQRFDRKAIDAQVRQQLAGWRALLTDEAGGSAGGRELLREVLAGPLTFTPEGREYRFAGEAAIGRVFAGMTALQPLWCARGDVHKVATVKFLGIAA